MAERPVELTVRVLDRAGAAVADAEVEVFVPRVARSPDGRPVAPNGRDACLRQQVATTDGDGRLRLQLAGPTLLSARKPGVGWSGDRLVRVGQRRLPDEWLLVLQPTGKVRGLVLRADGQPAVGATVEARLPDSALQVLGLPAVVADADGRFELEGIAGSKWLWGYQLMAVHGADHSRPQELVFRAGAVQEVVLHFPGAFAVRGALRDEAGAPSAGHVRLWGPQGAAAAKALVQRGECGADGRFEFLLDRAGHYWLVAGQAGKAPAVAAIQVDATRPTATAQLRLAPLANVRGRVLDDQGAPLAGRLVAIDPELPVATSPADVVTAELLRLQIEVRGSSWRATTDGDGRFAALAPPGWRCRALTAAVPGQRELWAASEPFAAPADEVLVQVRARDTMGFVLTGRVVAAADGAPVRNVGIERIAHGASTSSDAVGRSPDGAFRVGPLAPGGRASFAFTAEGFARTVVGPFDLTVREQELVVRLPQHGRVRCRVRRADGTPAASAWVVLHRETNDSFAPGWQGTADGEGTVAFDAVEPIALEVRAWASREAGWAELPPATAAVVVRPGQLADVVVELAR